VNAFDAITELFLAQHLGGRAEGIGDAFEDADFSVQHGAEEIDGLPKC
jgi:hypothetical protein